MPDYDFTADWFSHVESVWEQIVEQLSPRAILEIGAYEGRATCFLIERAAAIHPVELHCIDSWEGEGAEVEERFDRNVAAARAAAANPVELVKHKDRSSAALPRLLAEGRAGSFDLIYVDGSHAAADVLLDAVLAFELLRPQGMLIFDDYLWQDERPGAEDHYRMPKAAIDAFVNVNRRRLAVLRAPLYQLYVQKLGGPSEPP